jgi:hypothetical protein
VEGEPALLVLVPELVAGELAAGEEARGEEAADTELLLGVPKLREGMKIGGPISLVMQGFAGWMGCGAMLMVPGLIMV